MANFAGGPVSCHFLFMYFLLWRIESRGAVSLKIPRALSALTATAWLENRVAIQPPSLLSAKACLLIAWLPFFGFRKSWRRCRNWGSRRFPGRWSRWRSPGWNCAAEVRCSTFSLAFLLWRIESRGAVSLKTPEPILLRARLFLFALELRCGYGHKVTQAIGYPPFGADSWRLGSRCSGVGGRGFDDGADLVRDGLAEIHHAGIELRGSGNFFHVLSPFVGIGTFAYRKPWCSLHSGCGWSYLFCITASR